MGEYLCLTTKEGIEFKENPQSIGSEKIRLVDKRLKTLVKAYFGKGSDRFFIQNGNIGTKLATCEEVFFTFEEMVKINSFVKKYLGKFFVYSEGQHGNSTPEQILKYRGSLYLGDFDTKNQRKKTAEKVRLPHHFKKEIEHGNVWRKTLLTKSKTGKYYYKPVSKQESFGNPNGVQISCPNKGRGFKAIKVGFAWDQKTNKGRTLHECPKCGHCFNLGEYETPEYKELAKELM